MVSALHIYVVLLVLSVQSCNSVEKYCQEAVKSITKVDICPKSKEEWDKAASKKNCRVMAEMQNCTNTELFVYHCVIDQFRKETLELCAPKTIIRGRCPDFNIFRGIICGQDSGECNRLFPKCDNIYNSSDAYKYFDCYKLLCDSGIPDMPLKEITSNKTNILVPVIAALASLTFVFFITSVAFSIEKCNKLRQLQKSRIKKEAIYQQKLADVDVADSANEVELMPLNPVAGVDVAVSANELKLMPLYPVGVDVAVSVNEHELTPLNPVDLNTTEATLTTDDTTLKKRSVKELIETFEETPFIVRNDDDTGSTTDRHAFAMKTSRERLCEENKEESSRYIRCYEAMDRYFVETKAYKEAEEIFNNYGIIIMTGLPGCGKTVAAVHLILKQLDSNWTFRKINSRMDLSFVGKNEKTLLLIDNMFSDRTTQLHLEHWWEELGRIYNQYVVCEGTELIARCVRIAITARTNVIKRACTYMEKISPILNDVYLKDLGALTGKEKQNIFLKQTEFAQKETAIEINNIREDFTVNVEEGPIGFPLCAHLYVCREEYRKSGNQFFSRPIEYLKVQIKDEIERDKSNKTKSVFFLLFFQEWYTKSGNFYSFELKNESHCQHFLDNVSSNLLRHFGPFDFRDLECEAERLADAFFRNVDEHTYTFFHDSVFEAVEAYFCETYVIETAKYFPLDILQNQKYEHLTEKQQLTLITRLLYEIFDGKLNMVFACRIFQNKNFAECFCAELKQKDTKYVVKFFTLSNESSTVKLPTMFWSSCNNLTYLTELFYDIASDQNIELDYHLYASLYGMCCARNISMLQNINGIFQNNITVLQDHVFKFRDRKGNCILHLLVTSESSDKFVAVAMEKLAHNRMVIDSTNNQRVTPLMFAVEETVRKTKVIETILRFSPKLRYRDINSSTVFHHCLRSNNDDEMCAKYLRILLKKEGSASLLSVCDTDGNMALNIAANEAKHSRILSILELLESNVQIVHRLNKDGYSPLHLSVRSLKEDSQIYRIECCIRVIILILYSTSSNKLLHISNTVIDDCEYDCVKNILKNPKDCENMKKELNTLLEELKWKEDIEMSEAFVITSKFFDIGLRTFLNTAVHHLKNIEF